MRKYGLLSIILAIVFTLSSCALFERAGGSGESNASDASANTAGAGDISCEEYKMVCFDTMEEYDAYFTPDMIARIPNFVSYDMIGELGTYESFVFLCLLHNTEPQDYEYMYGLHDDSGIVYSLYVRPVHMVETKTANVVFDAPDNGDLRYAACSGYSVMTLDGVEYCYNGTDGLGRLICIRWREGNMQFELSAGDLYKYPLNTTQIGRLLHIETAQTAINAISVYQD